MIAFSLSESDTDTSCEGSEPVLVILSDEPQDVHSYKRSPKVGKTQLRE